MRAISGKKDLLGSKEPTLKEKFHCPVVSNDAEVTMLLTRDPQLRRVWLMNDLHVEAVNGGLSRDIRLWIGPALQDVLSRIHGPGREY